MTRANLLYRNFKFFYSYIKIQFMKLNAIMFWFFSHNLFLLLDIQFESTMNEFNGLRFINPKLKNKESSNLCFCNAGRVVKRMSLAKMTSIFCFSILSFELVIEWSMIIWSKNVPWCSFLALSILGKTLEPNKFGLDSVGTISFGKKNHHFRQPKFGQSYLGPLILVIFTWVSLTWDQKIAMLEGPHCDLPK